MLGQFTRDITTQLHNKEIFDMVSEICNFCMGKTKLGIYSKRDLTNTGGKYKWTDGENIHMIVDDSDVELKVSVKNWYEDTNSYNIKDLLKDTKYSVTNKSKKGVLDTNFKMMNFLKGKIRKIRISKILNTK